MHISQGVRRLPLRVVVVAALALTATVVAAPPVGASATVTAPAIGPALPPGGSFVPVPPTRVLDTRDRGGVTRTVLFDPRLTLPRDAATSVTAVLVNVTVVDALASGWVAVGPSNGTSNGNFVASAPSATLSLVRYAGRPVDVSLSVPADVVVDVQGYVTTPQAATSASFTPLQTARRIVDTRDGTGLTTFAAGQTQVLAARSLAGVPADATALVANLTVAGATAPTYVTGWSGVAGRPAVSSVNAGAGDVVANRALLPVDPQGRVALYNFAGRTDLVVDVVGYLSPDPGGSYYTPTSAQRLFDGTTSDGRVSATRNGSYDGLIRAPSVGDQQPTTAVWLTLVGDHPVVPGFVTARPADTAPTGTSDLNTLPARAVANAGPVRVSPVDGAVEVTASYSTRLVVDLSGWFRQRPAGPAAAGLWLTAALSTYDAPDRTDTVRAGPVGFAAGVFTVTPRPNGMSAVFVLPGDGTVVRSVLVPLQTEVGSWEGAYTIEGLTAVRSLATAGDHLGAAVYAVSVDGGLAGVGSNAHGELGSPPTPDPQSDWPGARAVPVPLPAGTQVTAAFAAPGVGYAVLADGRTMSWGRADTAQLGRNATATPWVPAPVAFPDGAPVDVVGDARVSVAIDQVGRTLWWGTPTDADGGSAAEQVTPTPFANGCARAARLYADADGIWELCTDATVVRLSDGGRLVPAPRVLPVDGVVQVAAGLGSGAGVRVRLADGRVADVTPTSARYEPGFAGVTAISGTRLANLTLVGG